LYFLDLSSFQWLAGRRRITVARGQGSGGKTLHGLPLFRRRRLPRADRPQGRPSLTTSATPAAGLRGAILTSAILSTALGNPHCGRCCAGPDCRNCATNAAYRLREALKRARDDERRTGLTSHPIAELMATLDIATRSRRRRGARRAPDLTEIERVIRVCGAHLLRSFSKNGSSDLCRLHLLGDADMAGAKCRWR